MISHTLTLPQQCLLVLCGPAACGKSTFARRHFRRTEIVSSDRCRALVADDEGALWASGRAFEVFYLIIKHRLEVGRFTVADSTALERRARMDLLRIARHAGRPAYLVMFDVSAKTCLKRDESRKRQVGPEVIARHRRLMDLALKSVQTEGFDEVAVITENQTDEVKVRRIGKGRNNATSDSHQAPGRQPKTVAPIPATSAASLKSADPSKRPARTVRPPCFVAPLKRPLAAARQPAPTASALSPAPALRCSRRAAAWLCCR